MYFPAVHRPFRLNTHGNDTRIKVLLSIPIIRIACDIATFQTPRFIVSSLGSLQFPCSWIIDSHFSQFSFHTIAFTEYPYYPSPLSRLGVYRLSPYALFVLIMLISHFSSLLADFSLQFIYLPEDKKQSAFVLIILVKPLYLFKCKIYCSF